MTPTPHGSSSQTSGEPLQSARATLRPFCGSLTNVAKSRFVKLDFQDRSDVMHSSETYRAIGGFTEWKHPSYSCNS